jgi:hypothetical protein
MTIVRFTVAVGHVRDIHGRREEGSLATTSVVARDRPAAELRP